MYCPTCGTSIEESGVKFCPTCGTAVQSPHQPASQVQASPVNPMPMPDFANENSSFQRMTEKEFYEKFASKNTKGWMTFLIVACFLSAALSTGGVFVMPVLALLDIAIYLPIGILLIKKKKWHLTLPLTIYSGIGTIIGLVTIGVPSGVLPVIAGIISTIKLKKLNAAYKSYEEHGVLPQMTI